MKSAGILAFSLAFGLGISSASAALPKRVTTMEKIPSMKIIVTQKPSAEQMTKPIEFRMDGDSLVIKLGRVPIMRKQKRGDTFMSLSAWRSGIYQHAAQIGLITVRSDGPLITQKEYDSLSPLEREVNRLWGVAHVMPGPNNTYPVQHSGSGEFIAIPVGKFTVNRIVKMTIGYRGVQEWLSVEGMGTRDYNPVYLKLAETPETAKIPNKFRFDFVYAWDTPRWNLVAQMLRKVGDLSFAVPFPLAFGVKNQITLPAD